MSTVGAYDYANLLSTFLSGNTYNGGATQGVGIAHTHTHTRRRDIGKKAICYRHSENREESIQTCFRHLTLPLYQLTPIISSRTG